MSHILILKRSRVRRPASTWLWLTLSLWLSKDDAVIALSYICLSCAYTSTFLEEFSDREFGSADKSNESLPLTKNRDFVRDPKLKRLRHPIPDSSTNPGKTVRDPEIMPVFSSTALCTRSGWCDGWGPLSWEMVNSRKAWEVDPLIELNTWLCVIDQENGSYKAGYASTVVLSSFYGTKIMLELDLQKTGPEKDHSPYLATP